MTPRAPIDVAKVKRDLRKKSRKDDPLESYIEEEVCEYAVSKGIDHRKYKTPARRGAPDQIFFPGQGRCFFIEFKRLGKKPTPNQSREHEWLRERGFIVYVADSIDSGKRTIDLWLALHEES